MKSLVVCDLTGTKAVLAIKTENGVSHRAKDFESQFTKTSHDTSRHYTKLFKLALPMQCIGKSHED